MTVAVERVAQGPDTQLEACIAAGGRAIGENRWEDAAKWFGRAVELAPGNPYTLGKLAFSLSRGRQYAAAIDVLQKVHDHEPGKARWPYMIGFQYYMQCQWAEAIVWFQRALEIHPDYLIVLYRKAYAHIRLAQVAEGARLLHRCMNIWEGSGEEAQRVHEAHYSDVCFQLGKLYLAQGLTLKARRPLVLSRVAIVLGTGRRK